MKEIKLTREQKKAVQEWLTFLEYYKRSRCPFKDLEGYFDYEEKWHRICRSWFPRTLPKNTDLVDVGYTFCPCSKYSLKYVERVAKRMIKK